jgi:GcrA cell cycle regulator
MSWTEERVSLLMQLWGNGKSASEIAEILGGVTRNAVIGKAHRLGLSGRPSPIRKSSQPSRPRSQPKRAAKPAAPKPMRQAPSSNASSSRPARIAAGSTPPPLVDDGPEGGATILDLTERMCRWPMGDPRQTEEFRFCGRSTVDGLVYCAHHAALAYQPARSSKRDDEDRVAKRAG